jgi:hypothetical protein
MRFLCLGWFKDARCIEHFQLAPSQSRVQDDTFKRSFSRPILRPNIGAAAAEVK